MTPERAKELIPILQAVADGKEVEYSGRDREEWYCAQYNILEEIINDEYDLRIKPKAEIIPFDYSDDLVGMVVIAKYDEMPSKKMVVFQHESGVGFYNDEFILYSELLENYTFLDGSPCGKERVEK